MPENNNIMSLEGQLVGMPLAGPESFSQQQLDYLKSALGVDETVLWTGNTGQITSATDGSLPLSEAAEHFEYLLVYVSGSAMSGGNEVLRFNPNGDNASFYPLTVSYTNDGATVFTDSCVVKIAGTAFYIKTGMRIGISSAGAVQGATNRGPIITKIVGIHRIAGGN